MKKKNNHKKGSKIKKIKRIRIKIKNKLESNYKFLIGGWNWKEKITSIKRQKKLKRMRIKMEKTIYHKFGLNNEIEN